MARCMNLLLLAAGARLSGGVAQCGGAPTGGAPTGGAGGALTGAATTGGAPTGGGVQTCDNPPCAASLLGDVAFTTVAGKDERKGTVFSEGENIYGPFENGFTSTQDMILTRLGCQNPSDGYLSGGIDTTTAEQMVAAACGITLPRYEGEAYIGIDGIVATCISQRFLAEEVHEDQEVGC
eukprot:CAMPEP_0203848844 /NCGR_PEP_ID=MMETSP0359-20131031/5833_1 /ASSEMBLY_ACC=CAM_ASM_000338 /TAXON_ID=268821 /ORGANISM="Scrippsiella Hangoei, Strain SHTV-5" /LENGTH=179 /DNA_ID=CAMNT_0050764497 /DNA_START=28 /DNA_END=567 /DNA_ORIENTATION=+